MGWRTISIEHKHHLKIRNNNLIIIDENNKEIALVLEELDTIIIDNIYTTLTIPTINELVKRDINLIINNDKHLPFSLLLPMSGHYRPLKNIFVQFNLNKRAKQKAWQQIIRQKIHNQKLIMNELGASKEELEKMENLEKEVVWGDSNNREATAAKIFFRSLYGFSFIRFSDDPINNSLNYGYKILASRMASSIIKYGLHPSFGFSHHNDHNYFNFAYDLIEPFRPLVDWITIKNKDLLGEDKLNIEIRLKHLKLLHHYVLVDGKVMRVSSAIDYMVRSVVSFLRENRDSLSLPVTFVDLDPGEESD